jgi:geranylgeranyl reductase family protein
MVDTETDVLVIGGGPAGVISGLTSAKLGCKVILIDAKSYSEIGHKTCGDAINLGPLNLLEQELNIDKPHGEEIAEEVKQLLIKTNKIEFAFIGGGYVLNRHPYGQRLLREAEKYGVEVRPETKALKAIVDSTGVKGAIVRKKGEKQQYNIQAKITIDCSGRNYQIRKTIPNEFFPYLEKTMLKRDVAASYREIIKLKEDHPYHNQIFLIYDSDIPEPGYFWIFSKGPKRLNIGIGWYLDMSVDHGMKDLFWDVLHKYYPPGTYEVEEKGGYTIPARYPLMNAVATGFLAVGDAAFHVNPFSAEGHGPALAAGFYAGRVAAEAIKTNDISENQLWAYNVAVMNDFGLSHTTLQMFTEALRAVKTPGLEFVFQRKILDQDQFLGVHGGKGLSKVEILKILIKGFPRYDLLYKLYKIANGAKKFNELFSRYPSAPEEFPEWYREFQQEMNTVRSL